MFGEEARVPGEFLVGRPKEDQTPASYAALHNKNLEIAFSSARENLGKAQLRSKLYYDNGVTSKIFKPGDKVRMRLKTVRVKPGSKFKPSGLMFLKLLSLVDWLFLFEIL